MQQKKLKHKGKIYLGTKKGGKICVSVEKTAKKQLIDLGVYDIEASKWQDTCRSQRVPEIVKKGFVTAFGDPV